MITNHPETRMGDKVLNQLLVSQRPPLDHRIPRFWFFCERERFFGFLLLGRRRARKARNRTKTDHKPTLFSNGSAFLVSSWAAAASEKQEIGWKNDHKPTLFSNGSAFLASSWAAAAPEKQEIGPNNNHKPTLFANGSAFLASSWAAAAPEKQEI